MGFGWRVVNLVRGLTYAVFTVAVNGQHTAPSGTLIPLVSALDSLSCTLVHCGCQGDDAS